MTPDGRPHVTAPQTAVRRRIAGAVVAGALAAGVLAGCGDDAPRTPSGADLTEMRCPLEPTGEQVGGVEQFRPAEKSFDTAELIGKPVPEARARSAEAGCEMVVAMQDGEGLPVSTDIDPKRINVYTENGVVTQIEGVGGGF